MSPLEKLETKVRFAGWRRAGWLIAFAVAGVVVWANFAELEEVAVASGEVVPQGQVKTIQHLEGGIISELFVTEGATVHANDRLLQLDQGLIGSTREEVQIELDGLRLVRARLDAESRDVPLEFPAEEAARRPDIVAAETQSYEGHKRELNGTIAVLNEQTLQRELELRQFNSQLKSAKNQLALAKEKFAMSADLLADGLTPRIEHVQLEQEVSTLQGDIESLQSSIPRASATIAEAKARITEETLRFRQRALEELSNIERKIAQVQESLSRATNQVVRTEIRSPIDGVVQSVRHHTIGGVVRPGEPLMEIVPTQEKLVVEARLNPTDIGYVRVGQPTIVKLSTYDFSRYGGLEGSVVSISPDSHIDPQSGQTFFKVVAETDQNYLGAQPGDLPISPGMEATLDIHTGTKSVIQYLVKPVVKVSTEAFRER